MKIAVLGGGHGGFTMAADLSMAGHEVNLYELPEFASNLKPVLEKGGINLVARKLPAGEELPLPGGGRSGFSRITGKVTTSMKEALEGVDLVMLVVPAFGRERFVREMSPHLKDGQVIVVWPAYFGALMVTKALKEAGCNKDIVVAETESLIYLTKKRGPAEVLVQGVKEKLDVAAFPATRTDEVVKILREVFPRSRIVKARNVLQTTLTNVNLVLHPPSTLLNLPKVERALFPYYEDVGGPSWRAYDITPGMARVMEAIDREIIATGEKLELRLPGLKETLKAFYGAYGRDLYETVLNCYAYQLQLAPTSIDHRFITEDVPYGLVPVSYLADQVGTPTPVIKALITIACAVTGRDFWREGLTMEKIGLAGKTSREIVEYVEKGGETKDLQ